jgi:hypothetical protein
MCASVLCGAHIIDSDASPLSEPIAVLTAMGSPTDQPQSGPAGPPANPTHDDTPEALTEFDSESIIAVRRVVIDAESPRSDARASPAWGYLALLAAFLLGLFTAIIALLLWQ